MKKSFERRFTMLEVAMLLVIVTVGGGNYAQAATAVPYVFPGGLDGTSRWGQVNEDFSVLGHAIDTISLTPGPQGPQGPAGPVGPSGATGPQGPAGSPDTADQVRDKFYTGISCAGNSANDIMVKVGPLCVDKYEASIWQNADGTGTPYGVFGGVYGQTVYPTYGPAIFPADGNWTTPLYAVSKPGVLPSSDVTWFQAQQACALSGKRLLTTAEWLMAAAGTPDPGTDNGTTDCVVSSAYAANTGSRSNCVSNWMVNDMVGNVWEWVADSSTAPRGGSYSDGFYAGVFAQYGFYAPLRSYGSFGFRCAR